MSRESSLCISYTVKEDENKLNNQLGVLLKTYLDFDDVRTGSSGIEIWNWSSEHYYLTQVSPLISGIVTSVFPDRNITGSGQATYFVVDDRYSYGFSYSSETGIIECFYENSGPDSFNRSGYYSYVSGIGKDCLTELLKISDERGLDDLIPKLNNISKFTDKCRLVDFDSWRTYEKATEEALIESIKDTPNLVIPSKLEHIAGGTFKDSTNIETLSFEEGVRVIGNGAFKNCTNLKIVIIGNGIETIGDDIFAGCSNLKSIDVQAKIKKLGTSFRKLPNLEKVILPDGLEEIGPGAFSGCVLLREINFPDSIKKIAENAFDGCQLILSAIPKEKVYDSGRIDADLIFRAFACCKSEKEVFEFFGALEWIGSFKKLKKLNALLKEKEEIAISALDNSVGYEFMVARNKALDSCIEKVYYPVCREILSAANDEGKMQSVLNTHFSESEIMKINLALNAYRLSEKYLLKDIPAMLNVSSSLVSKTSRWMCYEIVNTIFERIKVNNN